MTGMWVYGGAMMLLFVGEGLAAVVWTLLALLGGIDAGEEGMALVVLVSFVLMRKMQKGLEADAK